MRSRTSPRHLRRGLAVAVALVTAASLLVGASSSPAGAGDGAPELEVEVLIDGLSIPWDIAFSPNGTMLYTERGGTLSVRRPNGSVRQVGADLSDVVASGEGGLLGLVLHPEFRQNRRFFTCQYVGNGTVHVVSWTMGKRFRSAERRAKPIVSIEAGGGRHSGCRLRFGPEGALYIATGDGAVDSPNGGSHPQDLGTYAGKTLRVRANGKPWPDNPFIDTANRRTRRIYTYGHRNLQGLALRPCTDQMWTGEHGPSVEDEVNLLQAGGNYGWDPGPGYNEGVPMTDLAKFPDAVPAKWNSGGSTIAVSGVNFVRGTGWGAWDGALAVAALADQEMRMLQFNGAGNLRSDEMVAELNGTYGRLRSPIQGPDGSLYLTTSNGTNDRILRITPAGGVGEIEPCPGRV
jgi:aldose sugar dehydrogenase